MNLNTLKRLRVEKELSIRKLANLAGVAEKTICSIEKGKKAELLTLAKLSRALGTSIDELEPLAVSRG